jgi:hypothetical protein
MFIVPDPATDGGAAVNELRLYYSTFIVGIDRDRTTNHSVL